MTEGTTCYERDETLCEDQMCLRVGCKLRNERLAMNAPAPTELLPCPFCGSEAEFERTGTNRQSCIVICTECGCRHESGDEGDMCGGSWNTRQAASVGAEVAGEVVTRAVELLEEAPAAALRALAIEECANIAEAIDSGRGNEKQIAKSIRALASPSRSEGVQRFSEGANVDRTDKDIPPDWKQDQAETTRLKPRPQCEVQSGDDLRDLIAVLDAAWPAPHWDVARSIIDAGYRRHPAQPSNPPIADIQAAIDRTSEYGGAAQASLDLALLRDIDTAYQIIEREGVERIRNALADTPQRVRAAILALSSAHRGDK